MYPIKMKPINVYTIWGSDALKKIRGLEKNVGTSWDVSAHKSGDCVIVNGEYAGMTMSELVDKFPGEVLGKRRRSQLLRVGLLAAQESLSIQVHPDDEYAHMHEDDEGKTEAWYIFSAEPGSTLIAGTTEPSADKIKEAVDNDTIEDYVRRIPMDAGDFICIDSGMLHAFGKGLFGIEVGQNSDVTYRFYDFHRKDAQGKERPLHVKKSFDVARFDKTAEKISCPLDGGDHSRNLVRRREFTIDLVDVQGSYTLEPKGETFYCISNVSKDCELECNGEKLKLPYTESVFVPASCPAITVTGDTRLLISYVEE